MSIIHEEFATNENILLIIPADVKDKPVKITFDNHASSHSNESVDESIVLTAPKSIEEVALNMDMTVEEFMAWTYTNYKKNR